MIDYSYRTKFEKHVVKLLDLYDLFPFHKHPLWSAIINKQLTKEQVVKAEAQHYLRTKAGQVLRHDAMVQSASVSEVIWKAIIETYFEECTDNDGTPNHLEYIKRLIIEGGMSEREIENLRNTPGNIAAIALYKIIGERGPGCHVVGAGMVEYFYAQLSPHIFRSYVDNYGFTPYAVETYEIHGVMDQTHAERALTAIDEAVNLHGWEEVEDSVRDAFVATSLHYDGMLQAALGENNYWNGK
ncbi:iron-containing redox enzyme family protein [Xanthocytophaga agilis]|uniref:Iron-containing redox enzyme family protein n=1 Tax=Xanthocytophaga agilis TaxID=3048010 RepID=A0AAE3UCP9_9BACT|nr:iron-containing redox enzyme family protein [Xanthocytophaga agilis]MDJ1500325.1 iron-containing redox enzyme family protein [Xanthocytophaga agilis]